MQTPRPSTRRGRVLVLALGMFVATLAGSLVAARAAVDRVRRVPDVASVLSPSNPTVETFLLVGSDTRAGADPDSPDYGGIGSETDVTGSRSDTIMLLRRDKATGQAALLSIPRDLWVQIPGKGPNRINAAYSQGPSVLVQTVQQALGLPVHHYVEIDFVGFKSLVDAIGGVELCFLHPTRDTHTGLNVEQPGCLTMNGVQALSYARSRYYEQYIDGEWKIDGTADLGRTKRQQDFVNRALQGALAEVKANPFHAGRIIRDGGSAVSIDGDLDLFAAGSSLRTAVGSGLDAVSLPVRGETIGGKAVLQLADGSEQVLAWFAGTGPQP